MDCRRFSNQVYALGQAVNLLRNEKPFSAYHFERIANVLIGQIRRNHYVFTVDDERAVGYAGWAMCEESLARAWVERRYVPTFDECLNGDCVVGITFYAKSTAVCLYQARWCRNLYPNALFFGIRDYGSNERSKRVRNLAFDRRSDSPRSGDCDEPIRRTGTES